MDFAKIVDIFDENDVSFVSVTQQFNTTTSMGRLTLNVLLSFAQFEREVTAERIRDKIAASKKKGMWMGGTVPFGYSAKNRKLIVNEREAETVRFLFDKYLEVRSVRALVEEVSGKRISVRPRSGESDGSPSRTFSRGALYYLLSNPIYIGKVRHRDQIYDGEHEAIVETEVFERAKTILVAQAPARAAPKNGTQQHLLTGLLFDAHGQKLRAVHANKKGKRYHYYVSKQLVEGCRKSADGWRLPAVEVDSKVEVHLIQMFHNLPQLSEWIQEWIAPHELSDALERAAGIRGSLKHEPAKVRQIIRSLIHRITLGTGKLSIEIDRRALASLLTDHELPATTEAVQQFATITCPISLRRCGVETKLVLTDGTNAMPKPNLALINMLIRANRYLMQLTDGTGRNLTDVAKLNQTDSSEVSRLLPFAFLSPKIIEAILSGRQPVELAAKQLTRITDLSYSWSEQSERLGF